MAVEHAPRNNKQKFENILTSYILPEEWDVIHGEYGDSQEVIARVDSERISPISPQRHIIGDLEQMAADRRYHGDFTD